MAQGTGPGCPRVLHPQETEAAAEQPCHREIDPQRQGAVGGHGDIRATERKCSNRKGPGRSRRLVEKPIQKSRPAIMAPTPERISSPASWTIPAEEHEGARFRRAQPAP
jgi:hypothetical protein